MAYRISHSRLGLKVAQFPPNVLGIRQDRIGGGSSMIRSIGSLTWHGCVVRRCIRLRAANWFRELRFCVVHREV